MGELPAINCFSSAGGTGGATLRAVDDDPKIFFETAETSLGGTGRSLVVDSATQTSRLYSHPIDNDSGARHAREIGITNPFYLNEMY